MKRLKKDGGRRAALPAETHADLVETLFGTVGSLVSGIFGGLLVPVIAWGRTQDCPPSAPMRQIEGSV
jgi:hypothetical protein